MIGCDDWLHAQYISLLGGVGWMAQFRGDVAVYICSLQRVAKGPLIQHVVLLNRVLKWMKRKPVVLLFDCLKGPLRVMVVSDSAFKKVDLTGVACRGHIIFVCHRDRRLT